MKAQSTMNPIKNRLCVNSGGRFRVAMVAAAFGLVMLLSGCGNDRGAELVVYSAGPRSLAEWMCAEFERETGTRTLLYSATTGEIMAKLQAEAFRPSADIVLLASPTAMESVKEQGMLAALPEGLPARDGWQDPDGFYISTAASALCIAVRADAHDPDLDWDDIFEGRFQESMIMPSPLQSGTSGEFVTMFDLARGEAFWDGLKMAKERGLQISGPNSQALTSLVLGSHAAVLAAVDYLVFKQIEKGERLVVHFPPSGTPVIQRPVGILKGTANPDAAAEFVRFMFRKSAQEAIAAEHLIPADPEVPVSELRAASGIPLAFEVNPAEAKNTHQEALQRFQMQIERGQTP